MTKVSNCFRISLIKAVQEQFGENECNVEIGDRIVFKLQGGKVFLEPA